MNWTEGALARHSRRKGWNPGLARQREYFAKAKAGKKQTAPRESSFLPSYIPRDTPQGSSSSLAGSPVVLPLQDVSNKSAFVIKESSASRPTHFKVTPKRIRERPPSGSSAIEPLPDQIHSKRRKLLEQNDWTGVTLPKPPEVNFDHVRHGYTSHNKLSRRHRSNSKQLAEARHQHGHRRMDVEDFRTLGKGDHGSIRMKIGDRNLRWSQNGGSVRTALTHLAPSTAKSPSAATSMPSSPPVPISVISLSSPTMRSSRSVASRQEENKMTRIWMRDSPRLNPKSVDNRVPFLPDGPQYVVQSVPPNILHPTPAHFRASRLVEESLPRPETAVGSLVAETGRQTRPNGVDQQAEIDWQAFFRRHDGREAKDGACSNGEDLPLIPSESDQSIELLSVSRVPSASGARHDLMPVMHFNPTRDPESQHANEVNISSVTRHEDELGDIQHSGATPDPQAQPPESSEQWRPDPGITALLSTRQVSQSMMDLLEEQLHTSDDANKKPHADLEKQQASDEELWKKFMIDDDPEDIEEKARRAAEDETKRQIIEAQSTARSDDVEPPSTVCDEASTILDQVASMSDVFSDVSESGLDDEGHVEDGKLGQAASIVAEHGSPAPKLNKPEPFKMYVPAPFVGRLASLSAEEGEPILQPPRTTFAGKKGKGRSKKRWRSERPEIRAVPDCKEDPIEEDL